MLKSSFPAGKHFMVLCLLFFFFFSASLGSAQDIKLFRIGTGGIRGVYYPIGKAVAEGIKENALLPVYLKPEFIMDRFASGGLDGFSLMAGTPTRAITDLADHDLRLLPIASQMANAINQRQPYLVPGVIPQGTYKGIAETPTIEVHALLMVHKDLEENLVFSGQQ